MLFVAGFFVALFTLFLLSRSLTREISFFFHRLTHSRRATIYLLTIFFFPGTVVHELSHYFMARILFVRAYNIEFIPKLEGDTVKLGSVTVAKSDFLRRLLIGMAPFLVGTALLVGIMFFVVKNNLLGNHLALVIIGYLLFEIGNTMFSSKRDMEGALEVLFAVVCLVSVTYFIGFRVPASHLNIVFANPFVLRAFQKGSIFLLVPIFLDVIVIVLLKIVN